MKDNLLVSEPVYHYRIVEYFSAGVGLDWDCTCTYSLPRLHLILKQFPELKKTKCGVWINVGYAHSNSGKRFILNNSRKKFAYPSMKEAWDAFKFRKKRQVQILKTKLNDATLALTASELSLEEAVRRYNFDPSSPYTYQPDIYSQNKRNG